MNDFEYCTNRMTKLMLLLEETSTLVELYICLYNDYLYNDSE